VKIGIDVTPLGVRGGRHGTGSYLRGLLGGLSRHDGPHELLLFGYGEPPAPSGRFRWVRLPAPPLGRARALTSHQLALPLLARRLALDALHIPGVSLNASMPAIPLWQPRPTIVTVHDLIPLRFPAELLPRRRQRLFYRLMIAAVRRARHLICDSLSTRADLMSLLAIPAERITVAPLAADPMFTTAAPPGDARPAALPAGAFVVHVGGPAPHKNLSRVLRAMALLWATGAVDAHVVCVSSLPCDPATLWPEAALHRGRIHVLEDVPAPSLRWLYQHALCLVFPSLYEGFGLPVLEAMASGCPVIASRRASLPEVGGDAALYVEPLEIDSVRRALAEVIGDPRRREAMRAAGLRHAQRFSYDATARTTLDVYEGVAGRR